MKKKLIAGYFVGFILLTLTTLASANTISVFYNSSFVDTTREGPNFTTALTNLGHTVSTFTGYDSAAFSSAIAGGDILAFPEMEIGNLYNALDGTTRTLLQNYVSGGGGIVQANRFPSNENLPNGLFSWSLGGFSGTGTTSLTANAIGTPFEGGPATLPVLSAVEGALLSSLPGAAMSFYDNGTHSSVFGANFGSGHYVFLGYDWFQEQNADWSSVLDRAVSYTAEAEPIPEPATMLLLGTGLVGVAGAARRRKKNKA